MLSNYLKVAVRSLLKHKVYSAINVAGLAVGMACCILILLYVRDELSCDRFHAHAGRIYRVADEFEMPAQGIKAATALTPYPMGKALVASPQHVRSAAPGR